MYLQSIKSTVPPNSYTQKDCWDLFCNSNAQDRLKSRSVDMIEKVLLGNNGIDKRHFALEPVEALFDLSAEALNHAFESEAPKLAAEALTVALNDVDWDPATLDGLFVCTCTGYLCPGISSHVAESLGIRGNAYLQDLVGLGCGAAIPTLRAAWNMIQNRREKSPKVAVVAVEICSAAFYLEDDPGVLVSSCIFGDGAAATLWSDQPGPSRLGAGQFDTLHIPGDRELLRFINSSGKLKNRLHRSIPQRSTNAVKKLWERTTGDAKLPVMITHGGGRDVLASLRDAFPEQSLLSSWKILKEYGNISSPSVLFALEDWLNGFNHREKSEADLWLASFGAGFSAHSCRLSRTE